MTNQLTNHESLIDHLAAATVVGVWIELLPSIVAILAIIWYLIRIGEWCVEKYHNYKAKKNGQTRSSRTDSKTE